MSPILVSRAATSFDYQHPRSMAARYLSTAPLFYSDPGKEEKPAGRRPTKPPRLKNNDWLCDQVARYDASLPVEQAATPPSSWYTHFLELEREAVFFNSWIAAHVAPVNSGDYRTGEILGQPYLLTRKDESLQGFFNVCTHAGSCLVGPWTHGERISSSLVGKSTCGVQQRKFQCPYHGWEFNLDGKLVKATQLKGMQDFTAKQFDLKPIQVQHVGPIAFLNFGSDARKTTSFINNRQLLYDRLTSSGYPGDLQDVELVETRSYSVKCNWKVFVDNYGDGCYHCAYAHPDLSSNINESNYGTELLSNELSVQHAPLQQSSSNLRLGTRPAVYAYWYPNIMVNRYGPWLDVDMVIPVDDTSCMVQKAWFLERDFVTPNRHEFIQTSLRESTLVHDEDVFLCENAQRGMSSRGYDTSRYVPSKQVAAHHFHQRLAQDLKRELDWDHHHDNPHGAA
jgi:choline monooxygenase